MRIRSKFIVFIVLVGLLSTMLIGCQSKPATNGEKPSGTKEIDLCTVTYTNAYTDSTVAYSTRLGDSNGYY